jgi:hypothetical protein
LRIPILQIFCGDFFSTASVNTGNALIEQKISALRLKADMPTAPVAC